MKKLYVAPFYGWGSTASRLQSHYKEVVYFLPLWITEFRVVRLKKIKHFSSSFKKPRER